MQHLSKLDVRSDARYKGYFSHLQTQTCFVILIVVSTLSTFIGYLPVRAASPNFFLNTTWNHLGLHPVAVQVNDTSRFTLQNRSQFWYSFQAISPNGISASPAISADPSAYAWSTCHMIPTAGTLPFPPYGTSGSLFLKANFTAPGQKLSFRFDPASRDALSLDLVNLIIRLVGLSVIATPALGLMDNCTAVLSLIQNSQGFIKLVYDLTRVLQNRSTWNLGVASILTRELLDIIANRQQIITDILIAYFGDIYPPEVIAERVVWVAALYRAIKMEAQLAIYMSDFFQIMTQWSIDQNNPTLDIITTPPLIVSGTLVLPTAVSTPVIATGYFPIVPMPPTQTDCPTQGTARPAIMEPFATGSDPTIIYTQTNEVNNTITSTLLRYGVNMAESIPVVTLANTIIGDVQISTDGQWILFVSKTIGLSKLQLVRIDGQGLQTLYCTPPEQPISDALWSPDQQEVALNFSYGFSFSLTLLHIASGILQTIPLPHPDPLNQGYEAARWLDSDRIYMDGYLNVSEYQGPIQVYLFDISNPQSNTIQELPGVKAGIGEQFASSYDGTQLFTNGTWDKVAVQPATGGREYTIYSSSTLSAGDIAIISSKSLLMLLVVKQTTYPNTNLQYGLWKINTDGTGLKRLTADVSNSYIPERYSQYPWETVSRDGSMYAIEIGDELLFGSLNDNTSTVFATPHPAPFNNFTLQSSIVGWTTM